MSAAEAGDSVRHPTDAGHLLDFGLAVDLVATPLGYLLSRFDFRGRWLIDTIIDIPVVLPPLVIGLSLLILFHLPIAGSNLETWLQHYLA